MEEQTVATVVVGVIGFAGVITTLWYNGRETRAQRREERDHERDTLRTALAEELKINRTALIENAARLREDPPGAGGGAYVPIDPMEDVYLSLISKIGLLSEEEVSRTINAYLSLRTYKTKLFMIGVRDDRVPGHVQVPEENIGMLAGVMENLVGPVSQAIDALSQPGDG